MTLRAARIDAELTRLGARIGRPLRLMDTTGSTNDDARAWAADGAPHGAAVLADAQTSGRGRASHRWHSPPAESLYLSIVWRPQLSIAEMALLSLATGAGVARAVDAFLAQPRAMVKWPNDVFVDDRKIAGILCEAAVCGAQAMVVIGVGVNVLSERFAAEIAATATSLRLAGAPCLDRNALAARLLFEIGGACQGLERRGPADLLAELGDRDWLRGRPISVDDVAGVAEGIDERGRLRIRGQDGAVAFVSAGQVQLDPRP